jgi:hypothetical protein
MHFFFQGSLIRGQGKGAVARQGRDGDPEFGLEGPNGLGGGRAVWGEGETWSNIFPLSTMEGSGFWVRIL